MGDYEKLKKDDLIVALNERDTQITELVAVLNERDSSVKLTTAEIEKLDKEIIALSDTLVNRDTQITELLAGSGNTADLEKEITELNALLAEAMARLSDAEKEDKKGILLTRVGGYTVRGHGMSYDGVAYTIAELKNKPEVVKAIFETGSELVTKKK